MKKGKFCLKVKNVRRTRVRSLRENRVIKIEGAAGTMHYDVWGGGGGIVRDPRVKIPERRGELS